MKPITFQLYRASNMSYKNISAELRHLYKQLEQVDTSNARGLISRAITMLEENQQKLDDAVEELKSVACGDNEVCHSLSEKVLFQYLRDTGQSAIVEQYEANSEQCGGFWYA